jgi:DNA-binding CsgD family transcriptional regulator
MEIRRRLMGKVNATTIIDVIPLEENVMWLYYDGMSMDNIARGLDISENQVRKIVISEDGWKD